MNNGSLRREKSLRNALGIFRLENIYLSPEFIEEMKKILGIAIENKDDVLVLKKREHNGK